MSVLATLLFSLSLLAQGYMRVRLFFYKIRVNRKIRQQAYRAENSQSTKKRISRQD